MSIEWRDEFKVGHSEIDSQHEKLFELVNVFLDSDLINMNLNFNNVYLHSKFHFDYEENIMNTIFFPDYLNHKEQHRKFIKTLEKLAGDILAGKYVKNDIELFIAKWIIRHTAIEDTKLSKYIRLKYLP